MISSRHLLGFFSRFPIYLKDFYRLIPARGNSRNQIKLIKKQIVATSVKVVNDLEEFDASLTLTGKGNSTVCIESSRGPYTERNKGWSYTEIKKKIF